LLHPAGPGAMVRQPPAAEAAVGWHGSGGSSGRTPLQRFEEAILHGLPQGSSEVSLPLRAAPPLAGGPLPGGPHAPLPPPGRLPSPLPPPGGPPSPLPPPPPGPPSHAARGVGAGTGTGAGQARSLLGIGEDSEDSDALPGPPSLRAATFRVVRTASHPLLQRLQGPPEVAVSAAIPPPAQVPRPASPPATRPMFRPSTQLPASWRSGPPAVQQPTAAQHLASSPAAAPGAGVGEGQELVTVPHLGAVRRSQLRQLAAFLNGAPNSDLAPSELPDLRGLRAHEVRRVVAFLSSMDPLLGHGVLDVPSALAADGECPRRWKVNELKLWKHAISSREALVGQECAICCQPFDCRQSNTVSMPCASQGCSSFFHSTCIRPWLERNPNCPLCRRSLQELVMPRATRLGLGAAAFWPVALVDAPAVPGDGSVRASPPSPNPAVLAAATAAAVEHGAQEPPQGA